MSDTVLRFIKWPALRDGLGKSRTSCPAWRGKQPVRYLYRSGRWLVELRHQRFARHHLRHLAAHPRRVAGRKTVPRMGSDQLLAGYVHVQHQHAPAFATAMAFITGLRSTANWASSGMRRTKTSVVPARGHYYKGQPRTHHRVERRSSQLSAVGHRRRQGNPPPLLVTLDLSKQWGPTYTQPDG